MFSFNMELFDVCFIVYETAAYVHICFIISINYTHVHRITTYPRCPTMFWNGQPGLA